MRNEIEDMKRYMKSMMDGGMEALAIEEKYGLDGYPPEIVTTVLNARVSAKHEERERIYQVIAGWTGFWLDHAKPADILAALQPKR